MNSAELRRAALADLENEALLAELARAVDREGGIEGRPIAEWVADLGRWTKATRAEEVLKDHALEATIPLIREGPRRTRGTGLARCLALSPSPLALLALLDCSGMPKSLSLLNDTARKLLFSGEHIAGRLPQLMRLVARQLTEDRLRQVEQGIKLTTPRRFELLLPILREAAADRDPALRQVACAALGGLRNREAAAQLLALIDDPEAAVRARAFRALARRSAMLTGFRRGDAAEHGAALVARLPGADEATRLQIITALRGCEPSQGSVEALRAALRDPIATVRVAAMEGLTHVAPELAREVGPGLLRAGACELLPSFLRAVRKPEPLLEELFEDGDRAAREAVLANAAIDRVSPDFLRDLFQRAMSSGDSALRVFALGRLGEAFELDMLDLGYALDGGLSDLLRAGLEDASMAVRRAAAEALPLHLDLEAMLDDLWRLFRGFETPAGGSEFDAEALAFYRALLRALAVKDPATSRPALIERLTDRTTRDEVRLIAGLALLDILDDDRGDQAAATRASLARLAQSSDPLVRDFAEKILSERQSPGRFGERE